MAAIGASSVEPRGDQTYQGRMMDEESFDGEKITIEELCDDTREERPVRPPVESVPVPEADVDEFPY